MCHWLHLSTLTGLYIWHDRSPQCHCDWPTLIYSEAKRHKGKNTRVCNSAICALTTAYTKIKSILFGKRHSIKELTQLAEQTLSFSLLFVGACAVLASTRQNTGRALLNAVSAPITHMKFRNNVASALNIELRRSTITLASISGMLALCS